MLKYFGVCKFYCAHFNIAFILFELYHLKMADDDKRKVHVHKRKYLRKRITELSSTISSINSQSKHEKLKILESLNKLSRDIDLLDSQIFELSFGDQFTDNQRDQELEQSCQYEQKLLDYTVCVQQSLQDSNSSDVSMSDNSPSVSSGTFHETFKLKLPSAPLPQFKSSPSECLETFFSNFESVILKFNLSQYEKFILLKQNLQGRASVLIESLESTKHTYDEAKNFLVNALDSPLTRKYKIIQDLMALDLSYDKDPYVHASQMRMIKESFSNLDIDVDCIIQFFFWKGFNQSLKSIFVNITNNTYPTLSQIEENLFPALERYEVVQSQFKRRKNNKSPKKLSNSLSVGAISMQHVNSKHGANSNQKHFRPCNLCSGESSDHPIYKCLKYKSPKDKLDRIKVLNGCTNCAYMNHRADSCNFKFRDKCKHCQEAHFSYLCDKGSSVNINTVESQPSTSITTNLLWSGLTGRMHDGSALPTFTCDIGVCQVRALKDSGSQFNVLAEKYLDGLNYEIVCNNVRLQIEGINIPKLYITKIVQFDVTIGGKKFTIKAVVIPELKTVLRLPGVSTLCKTLIENGYELADKRLLNESEIIDDIGLILGTISSYVLPIRTVVFGSSDQECSTILESPAGYMLEGSVSLMLSNLSSLSSGLEVGSNMCIISEDVDESLSISVNHICLDNLDTNEFNTNSNASPDKLLYDVLNYDDPSEENNVHANEDLFQYLLNSTEQQEDGYLQMPILWDGKMHHKIGGNFHLSKTILNQNVAKLRKSPEILAMTDEVFKTQEKLGIIKRIPDIDSYLKDNPCSNFVPHMSVVKMDRQSTKCRVVYLSNLCEKNRVSLNQAIHPGPNLNNTLVINFILLRLNSFLMIFDIVKAFHNIRLSELDSTKFIFLWFKNVLEQDYSLIYYCCRRLPFGLPCSPALLMVALYKILLVDDYVKNFKLNSSILYQQAYMDNLSYSCNDEGELLDASKEIPEIFRPYNFDIQQCVTNSDILQDQFDSQSGEETPECVKLLGIIWNRRTDIIGTKPIALDKNADTKRKLLSSIAEQYDPMGYAYPLLNRARNFINMIQNDAEFRWDTKLSKSRLKVWSNICHQVNGKEIKVSRCIGTYDDIFTLHCFCDTSKTMYGIVIYLRNNRTNEVNLLFSKGRMISKSLSKQSIPALELHALCYGTECLLDFFRNLTGITLLKPLNISQLVLWTDSMVSLSWIDQFTDNRGKLNSKRNVFVLNRLNKIEDLTKDQEVTIKFVAGDSNPSDFVTREVSYNKLISSNFFSGPDYLQTEDDPLCPTVHLPKHATSDAVDVTTDVLTITSTSGNVQSLKHLVPLDRFSKIDKLINTVVYILMFINILRKNCNYSNLRKEAVKYLIRTEQRLHFPDVYDFLESSSNKLKDMPNVIKQFNVFLDKDSLLRVGSKFIKDTGFERTPLLLARKSKLTELIVRSLHEKMSHAGVYSVLSEFRKEYYVPKCYSFVKIILQACVTCRRFNRKAIKLNQSVYRNFRSDPPPIPFRSLFLDYFGPYIVKFDGNKSKVWIMIFTCLWCRGVNLKVVRSMDVKAFLLAFQLHVHEYGMPENVISDLGSQIVPASKIIVNFLNDVETKMYFSENNIDMPNFEQFFKGNSSLGSIVEICVKLSKRLIFGSIKNNIIEFEEFEYVISLTKCLINKRPISFKNKLRDDSTCLDPITPEILIKGFSSVVVNVVPNLHPRDENPEFQLGFHDDFRGDYSKLSRIRENLMDIYQKEFIQKLIDQAVDRKDRYVPVKHDKLSVGDIVLIIDKFRKPCDFDLAIVHELQINKFNEITGAIVFKGKTREKVKRHVTTLIKLLSPKLPVDDPDNSTVSNSDCMPGRPQRHAANACVAKNRKLFEEDMV